MTSNTSNSPSVKANPTQPLQNYVAKVVEHPQARYVWLKALRGQALSSGCLGTLRALAEHGSINGEDCYPSVGLVAFTTGQSKATVRRHLKEAMDAGFLKRQERLRKDRSFTSNLYRFCIPQPSTTQDKTLPDTEHLRCYHQCTPRVSPVSTQGLASAYPRSNQRTNQLRYKAAADIFCASSHVFTTCAAAHSFSCSSLPISSPQRSATLRVQPCIGLRTSLAGAPRSIASPSSSVSPPVSIPSTQPKHAASTATSASSKRKIIPRELERFYELWSHFELGAKPSWRVLLEANDNERITALAWLLVRVRNQQVTRSNRGVFLAILQDCSNGTKSTRSFSLQQLEYLRFRGSEPDSLTHQWFRAQDLQRNRSLPKASTTRSKEQNARNLLQTLSLETKIHRQRGIIPVSLLDFAQSLQDKVQHGQSPTAFVGVVIELLNIITGKSNVPSVPQAWVLQHSKLLL